MTIYVYRDGEEIRSWPEEEFQALISRSEILPGDYFRPEGASEWSLVSTYTSPNRQESEGPSTKDTASAKRRWRSDCATEKQINYLASFGVTAPAGLTKGEASDLIERCLNDPEAVERQRQFREIRYEEETRARASFPSFYLKSDIAGAAREIGAIKERRDKTRAEVSAKKKQLALANRSLEQATHNDERATIQTEIDDVKADLEAAESELSDFPVELEDAQTDLKVARSRRLSFWKATFKEGWGLTEEENRLIEFADSIDRLYAQYGRYLKVPTNKQVTEILEALDKESPDWDKREPDVFYTRLKAMIPDLGRRSASPVSRSRSQGCLVLLVGIAYAVVYYVVTHS